MVEEKLFAATAKEEYAHLSELVVSDGWEVFRRMCAWRKDVLNLRAIKDIRDGELNKAQEAVAKLDEVETLVKMPMKRIEATKQRKE